MISAIVQGEGGVECLRAVEEIPAGVEVTISYRSIIMMMQLMIMMRLMMTIRMAMITILVFLNTNISYQLGHCDLQRNLIHQDSIKRGLFN